MAHVGARLELGLATHWVRDGFEWLEPSRLGLGPLWATASLDDTTWTMVVAPWTLPWVATMVATAVVAMVEPYGGSVAPLIVMFSLVDRRGPIS